MSGHEPVRQLRRREFLRVTALGMGGTVLAGLLAACGGGAAAAPTVAAVATTAPTAATSGAATAATAATVARPATTATSSAAVATGGGTATRAATATAGAAGTPRASATATRVGVVTPGALGTPIATGTVTFSVSGDTAEKEAYGKIVAAFNGRQSRVAVNLAHTPSASDYVKRLTADLAAGTPPDIVLMNYRRFGAFFARGAFEPIAPYLAASSALQQSAFYPEVVSAFSRGGQLIGIPQNASSLVIYYNKNLFQQAGVALPKDDWNWEGFLAAAQGLTKGTAQYGIGISTEMIRLAPFIWQNGGDIVDNLANPTKLTLDRAESVEAMQWFVDLQTRHKVAPDAVQLAAEDDESRFLNGRSAMLFESRRIVPTLRTITAFDWDVAPLPSRKTRASILHSDAYLLTAVSKNKAAAFSFMEYANSAEGQTFIAQTGRTVPSIKAIAVTPIFLDPAVKPANNRVFLNAIPIIRSTINTDRTEEIEGIVNNELKRAFYGQATVAEAISTAQNRTAGLFK
ncbi:MAG TPA: sugar ABC transporter substrate-binding protein [Thermomicrobiales bacterium]